MAYDVRLSRQARRDIQDLSDYLMRYNDETARIQVSGLARAIERNIAVRPFAWQFFFLTGAPNPRVSFQARSPQRPRSDGGRFRGDLRRGA